MFENQKNWNIRKEVKRLNKQEEGSISRMPKQFVENESYMHKAAKKVLQEWLLSVPEDSGDRRNWGPLSFRTNRSCGVWLEYPVAAVDGTNSINWLWDEQGLDNDKVGLEYIPSYEECVKKGIYPIAVLDIAIAHKGTINYGIEVCHKHKLCQKGQGEGKN